MVLSHVMMLPRFIVSTPDDYGGHQRKTHGLGVKDEIKQARRAQSRPGSGAGPSGIKNFNPGIFRDGISQYF